ncbi:hypothetical protein LNP74_05565 [Klebsiella pneumoniae subsp. pneumoniae]|nr:hypothetical protein [Klebsiella pneumoniae subsp. pneumoniae]
MTGCLAQAIASAARAISSGLAHSGPAAAKGQPAARGLIDGKGFAQWLTR